MLDTSTKHFTSSCTLGVEPGVIIDNHEEYQVNNPKKWLAYNQTVR